MRKNFNILNMGCRCKDNSNKEIRVEVKSGNLNLKDKLLKVVAATALTVVFTILSPILLCYIWYISMSSIFGEDTTLLKALLKRFKKDKEQEFDEEFTESEYEIEGLEVIK